MSVDLDRLMQAAVNAHNGGQLEDAATVYRTVLRFFPDHYDALRLLGSIHLSKKNENIALINLKKALSINSNDADLCRNVAHCCYRARDNLAAIYYFDLALISNVDDAAACAGRAAALSQLDRYEEALASYDRAIAIEPHFSEAHSNRGTALAHLHRHEEAVLSYDCAIAIDPGYAEAFSNRGVSLGRLNRHEEAILSYDRAVAIKPSYFEAHRNCGLALTKLHRHEEAVACYDRAIALNPAYAEAHSDRGNGLGKLNRHAEALLCYDHAIALKPGFAEAHSDRGAALAKFRRHVEAITSYDHAIALKPDLTEPYWNKSLSLLAMGHYESGWKLYEWRKKRNVSPWVSVLESIDSAEMVGKRVIIHWEQGIGDTIQFCRYVPMVAKIAYSVLFVVPDILIRLLSGLFPGVVIVGQVASCDQFDMHCFLMSLPLAFGTSVQSIPAEVSYIRAPRDASDAISQRLGPRIRPRVGLVWNGGFRPGQPEMSSINQRRNMDFSVIAGLNTKGIDFYSLQKGEPAESEVFDGLSKFWKGDNFFNLTGDIADFADTAALIDNLDMVISVDTSTAHLAAAMGKPVWILNRFDACWRWLLDRTESPWYPSVRLFHQSEPGGWDQVIVEVRAELEIFWALNLSYPAIKGD